MVEEGKVLNWLLEEDTPFVRYGALTQLLGRERSDPEVEAALESSMSSPPISRILEGQLPSGGFRNPAASRQWGEAAVEAGYFPKYRGSAWKLMFLAQAGADHNNPRVRALAENLLAHAYSTRYGTFDIPVEREKGPFGDFLIPCFMGNMVWSLCSLGYGGRNEVRSAFEWIVRYQRFDDGNHRTPSEFPYRGRRDRCWGAHTCYWGVTKLLRAMTVVPETYWNDEAKVARNKAIDFVLIHRLIWSSHTPTKPIAIKNTMPQRLTAPITYYDDAVEIASSMLALGVRDPAVEETVDFVLSKRNDDGRWSADNTIGQLDSPFAYKGRESKFVTLRSLRMLKLAGRISF